MPRRDRDRDLSRICYRFGTGTPLQVHTGKSSQHWQPAIPPGSTTGPSTGDIRVALVALRVKVLVLRSTHNLASLSLSLRALRAASESVTGGQAGRTPAGGRPGRSLTPSDSDSDAVSRLTHQKAGLTCELAAAPARTPRNFKPEFASGIIGEKPEPGWPLPLPVTTSSVARGEPCHWQWRSSARHRDRDNDSRPGPARQATTPPGSRSLASHWQLWRGHCGVWHSGSLPRCPTVPRRLGAQLPRPARGPALSGTASGTAGLRHCQSLVNWEAPRTPDPITCGLCPARSASH
jgi:hypothetical protein